MSKINRRPVRRTAAGVLASTLMLSGVVAAGISPANAATGFALNRIEGANRYETSAQIATAFGPTTSAILASGEAGRTVDALSANFLAGVQQAPVLLTQRNRVPGAVRAVLNTLTGAKNVTIVGGTAAVSQAVEDELRTAGFTVTRLGGEDRYATSEAIITAGRTSANPIGIVASGTSFPDALAAGPLAYKGKHPIFLTSGGTLPQDTIDAMVAAGTTRVIVLGGTAAVPEAVVTALAARNITVVTRLGGAGRSDTSRLIAEYLIANQGFTNTTFNVASGAPRGEGADALSGAALSGKENRALLITDTATQGAPVVAFATNNARTLNAPGRIFGGPAAVAETLRTAIVTAGAATPSNQAFTVTQAGTATVELGGDVASRTRTFTVAVPANTNVDIQLFNPANVITAANGQVTFVDANSDNVADPGTVTGASITAVNGVPGTPPATGVVSSGSITFTVTGTAATSVVPVIFADANNDNQLNLVAPATANANPKAPSEQFAVGAPLTFIPAAAALGSSTATVVSVTAAEDFFIGNVATTSGGVTTNTPFTYRYDANDVFQYQGVAITLAQFESLLSSGDVLSVAFSPTATGVSTFNVTTDALPTAVGTPTATVGNLDAGAVANDVRITFTQPTGNAAGVTYTLQRRLAADPDNTTFVTVTTATQAPGTTAGTTVFTDVNVPNGTYVYRVVATNPVSGGTAAGTNTASVVVPPAADVARPTAVFSAVRSGTGLTGTLDAGDVITIAFNEALAAPTAGDLIRLQDADGTIVDVINGTNATFALNTASATVGGSARAAGEALTITLTANPTGAAILAAGTTVGLQLPATIVDQSGNLDPAGNAFDFAAGAGRDVQVNVVTDITAAP